ncbi:cysteine desulfurase [Candidatus Woesearchaeota archaeon]|nr:cysteine desulfurase [Candidatus Woesearchaeota archaeon]
MPEIYLDNASTTQTDKLVVDEMKQYFTEEYGNPSSTHTKGVKAKEALENARKKVASILVCLPEEIIFTAGGTESINLAIQGTARVNKNKGKHIITTKIEHPAVLKTCEYLEKNEGFSITYLDVDLQGLVNTKQLSEAIKKETTLITIQYANNEIGTIQQITDIGRIARQHNILFHTDACQAAGYLDINVNNIDVDLMTLNGSKIYGPKGTGILYARKGTSITPLIFGGGQEHGLRSGTENVPSIVGFAKALEIATAEKEKETQKQTKLRDKLLSHIKQIIPDAQLNGHPTKRLPNNLSITIPQIDAETIVTMLNEHEIFTSTGSACTSHSIQPSHVLTALGQKPEQANSTLRITIGKHTTEEHINKLSSLLSSIVKRLKNTKPNQLEEEK